MDKKEAQTHPQWHSNGLQDPSGKFRTEQKDFSTFSPPPTPKLDDESSDDNHSIRKGSTTKEVQFQIRHVSDDSIGSNSDEDDTSRQQRIIQTDNEKTRKVRPPNDTELCRIHGLHTWRECFLNPDGCNYRVYVNGEPMAPSFGYDQRPLAKPPKNASTQYVVSNVAEDNADSETYGDSNHHRSKVEDDDQLPWDVIKVLANDLRHGFKKNHKDGPRENNAGRSMILYNTENNNCVRLKPVRENDLSLQFSAPTYEQSSQVSVNSAAPRKGNDVVYRSKQHVPVFNAGTSNNASSMIDQETTSNPEVSMPSLSSKPMSTTLAATDDDPEEKKQTLKGQWEFYYKELLAFMRKTGHANVPQTFENKKLAVWVKRQRRQYKLLKDGKSSSLTSKRIELLESIGFVWDSHELNWREKIEALKEFKQIHGHCNVAANYKANKLGMWVKCQRRQYKLYKEGKLSCMDPARIKELENLGLEWKLRDRKTTTTKS